MVQSILYGKLTNTPILLGRLVERFSRNLLRSFCPHHGCTIPPYHNADGNVSRHDWYRHCDVDHRHYGAESFLLLSYATKPVAEPRCHIQHISISGVRLVQTFAQELDGSSTPPVTRSAVLIGLASVGLNFAQVLVGDGFLLYRMAVVWGRDWRIYVFPLILLSASTGTY